MGASTTGFQSNGITAIGGSPLSQPALTGQLAQGQAGLQQNEAQQQQLSQALLSQSQGGGPNPAQMLTQQATQGAIAQNQGMIASQKGISPAMAQRLGAQNAASMSQQSAGQGAMLGAQQQMGAQQQLGQNINAQAGQNLQSISTSGGLANQSALGGAGIAAGLQAQQNAANSNMMGGAMQGIGMAAMMNKGGMAGLDEGGWSDVENAIGSFGHSIQHAFDPPGGTQHPISDQTVLQTPTNNPDSDNSEHKASGGLSGDSDLNALNQAQTPYSTKMMTGQQLNPNSGASTNPMGGFAQNNDASSQIANKMLSQAGVNVMPAGNGMGNALSNLGQMAGQKMAQNSQNNKQTDQAFADFDNTPDDPTPSVTSTDMSFGSPGEDLSALAKGGPVIPPHLHGVASIYHPHMMKKNASQPMPERNVPSTVAALKAVGGGVPGKPKVQGDSPKNDTVPTMLSPGEMVIPRSVMNSEDPVKGAADFVASKLKEKSGSGSEHGDFKEALKRAVGSRRK